MVKIRWLAGVAALLAVAASDAVAQRRISGRVVAEGSGEPLGAASVQVVGSMAGTYTADDGRFSLVVPSGAVTLRARRVGYAPRTATVAVGQDEITLALTRDVLQLEGVTVTGEATTISRRLAAVATDQVTAEELNNAPAASLDGALQGKITGAVIRLNSGQPGGGGQIQIRGPTSILGNTEPLVIIDGVAVSNASVSGSENSITLAAPGASPALATTQDDALNRLSDINPNDIESVEVLKSAAAAAIYGAKATNGVIVITTKRGRAGEPRFNLTQRVGTQSLMRKLGSRRFGTDPASRADLESIYSQAIVDSIYANGGPKYYDYQGDLFGEKSLSHETHLSMTGGSTTSRYLVSATNKDDAGILKKTGARRQSLRLNVDQTFGSRWTAAVGGNLIRAEAARGLSGNDNSYTSPLYLFGYQAAVIDLNRKDAAGNYVMNPLNGGGSSASNPFQTFEFLKNDQEVYRLLGSGRVEFAALNRESNQVRLIGVAGVDRFDQDDRVYSPGFLQYEGNDNLLGTAAQSNTVNRQYNTSLSAVWSFMPSGGLFSATTSASVQKGVRNQTISRIRQRGLLPTVENANQGAQVDVSNFRSGDESQAFSFGEDLFAFDERLTLQGGVRFERSSLNGDTKKFFVFPRGAISYRFVDPFANLDELKLRVAVGQTGNQARYGDRFVTFANFGTINGENSLGAAATVGNPNIQPERMTEVEFGFDLTAMDNRIGLEATRFDRTITDLLLNYPLPPASGLGSQTINGGELSTEGTELALRAVPLQNARGLTWISRVSYYTFKALTVDLPTGVPAFLVGSTGFGAAFGRNRQAEGVSTTSIWGNRPVNLIVRDANGRPIQNAAGRDSILRVVRDTIVGDARPDFQMQFTNELTFRNFSVNALVDWRKGGVVSNMTQTLFDEGLNSHDYTAPSPCRGAQGTTDPANFTTPCYGMDVSPTATLGAYRYAKWAGGTDSRVYIQDGSYVKVREISVGYAVPNAWSARLLGGRAQDVRLTFAARNPFWFSDYWSFDPEVNNFGAQNTTQFVDLSPFPPSRSFFFSVDVGF